MVRVSKVGDNGRVHCALGGENRRVPWIEESQVSRPGRLMKGKLLENSGIPSSYLLQGFFQSELVAWTPVLINVCYNAEFCIFMLYGGPNWCSLKGWLVRIRLVIPTTNATSERFFFTLRRVKTYNYISRARPVEPCHRNVFITL